MGIMSVEAVEQIHRLAVNESTDRIAQSLQETLGQRLVAFAIAIKDPKAIGKYAGGRTPRTSTEARLRDLFFITRVLLTAGTAQMARAWMIGANPQLEDRAPIELLHEGQTQAVLRAAQAFVQGG
jgi:hypothetical protein